MRGNSVNRYTQRIRKVCKGGVENDLVPASVLHGLQVVRALRKGRTDVRESKPVRPVPGEYVDAIRPHVSAQVWAMIELQRLTGMRSGEAVRSGDSAMKQFYGFVRYWPGWKYGTDSPFQQFNVLGDDELGPALPTFVKAGPRTR